MFVVFHRLIPLCLMASVFTSCSAEDMTPDTTLCRPLSHALLMDKDATRLNESLRDFVRGKANAYPKLSGRTDGFEFQQSLPVSAAILSNGICTGAMGSGEFEPQITAWLEHRKTDLQKRDIVKRRYKQIVLLKYEALGQEAIASNDWPALRAALSALRLETKTWETPLPLKAVDPMAPQRNLQKSDELLHYKRASLETYFTGRIAIHEKDPQAFISAMMVGLRLNTDYGLARESDLLTISHPFAPSVREALVSNSLYLMDMTYHAAQSDMKISLNPEQKLALHIAEIRSVVIGSSGLIAEQYQQTLSPASLQRQLSRVEKPAHTLSKDKFLALNFIHAKNKFTDLWHYDYGPYLWKYMAKLNVKFWENNIKDLQDKALVEGKQSLCDARLLEASFKTQAPVNCP